MISKEQKQVKGREVGRRVFQAEGTAWTTVIMEHTESSGNMSRVVSVQTEHNTYPGKSQKWGYEGRGVLTWIL